jgi:hypothetical protein
VYVAKQRHGGFGLGARGGDVRGGQVDALVRLRPAGVPAHVAVGQHGTASAVVQLKIGVEPAGWAGEELPGARVGVGDGGCVVVAQEHRLGGRYSGRTNVPSP